MKREYKALKNALVSDLNNSTVYCYKDYPNKLSCAFVPCYNYADTQDVDISTTAALLDVSVHGQQSSSSAWTHHRFRKMQNNAQPSNVFSTERGCQKFPHNQIPYILLE